jgi:acyl carrier protein
MSDQLAERVRAVIADTLNVPKDSVTMATAPGELPAWDSLGQLNIVLGLEQEFAISIPPDGAEAMTDVASIVALLRPLVTDQ